MEERISVREWQSTDLSSEQITDIRGTIARLKTELRPTLDQASITGNLVTVQNLIGSARMPSGAILEVVPKGSNHDNWADAVVQLLDSDTRIAVTGSQRSRQAPKRNDLSTAVALEYARRLEYALHHEGPIQVYEHLSHNSRRLNGHLNISKWVRSSLLNPIIFPVERDDLTIANDFARALSKVSGLFHRSALNGHLASRLRTLESAIIPGHPLPEFVNSAVALRNLPPQWAKYRPAWDIAASVLRNRSVVGDPGRATGLEVAVEPWPLLETLLERSLREFTRTRAEDGYTFQPKKSWPLLVSGDKSAQVVLPDGLLHRHGVVKATFEAKYTRTSAKPAREHTFQALATAAALHSPLAVIVYAGEEPLQYFDVKGFHGTPTKLATVGLSMFTYTRQDGDGKRADILEELLAQAGTT